jgi:formate hydrogenlyase subunit 6/NADH:ubiquinone oxidoreductase subunit I
MKILEFAKKEKMVTNNFPVVPYEVTDGFRGKPEYNYANCIGCGACTVACPSNALSLKKDEERGLAVWKIDYNRCIFCGRCDEVCPTEAITLSKDYVMCVLFDKEDLTVTGELKLKRCSVCSAYFTTERLNNLVYEKLVSAGWDRGTINEKMKHINTCPQCRRERAVINNVNQIKKRGV